MPSVRTCSTFSPLSDDNFHFVGRLASYTRSPDVEPKLTCTTCPAQQLSEVFFAVPCGLSLHVTYVCSTKPGV
ncbi:hypothetical protein [Catellatospora tritici]|uniref:hypothetical protein n=1 Tax=Catellatospora tritici TaxID=2851566 RepID=UPI001C2D403F|nr:hypothetical protein [Catellatospora tritici]MBV1856756.1 hypothetical protein [Catellatospora tritici]